MVRTLYLLALAFFVSGCQLLPESSGPAAPTSRSTGSTAALNPTGQKCLAELGRTGSRFTPLPDKYYGAGCSTLNAVNLSALRGDRADFALSNLGPVTCPMASAFSAWARFGVDRAARQILGSPLQRIETMGSYACRNVSGSSRRSAHSTADAVDVAAFVLADGRRVSLSEAWSGRSNSEREFLRVIHRSACKRFGTVLGPDYNSAHRDHFHLERSNSEFCR